MSRESAWKHLMNTDATLDRSPYWDWMKYSCRPEEPLEANPDGIFELPFNQSEEMEAVLHVLANGGEALLSPREKQAFQLVVREGRTYGEAALVMSGSGRGRITRAAVQMYVNRAGKKLRKMAEKYL